MHALAKTFFILALMSGLAFGNPQGLETTTPPAVRPGEWLREWLLCGPIQLQSLPNNTPDGTHIPGFETDYLREHGGEKSPRIRAGQVETFPGGSGKWVRHTAPDSAVNLDRAISDTAFVLAYAYTEFTWPREETVILALGSNDGGRAWLNGEQVWDRPEARGLKVDDDQILVRLRKGRNSLLLKIEERGNRWEFCARLLSVDAAKLETGQSLFRVINRADGSAALRFLHPLSGIETLFSKLDLTITTESEPESVAWQGRWARQQEMALPMRLDRYGRYNLKMAGILSNGGGEWSSTTPFAAGRRTEYRLFVNGSTDYTIIVGTQASESERWAARELQQWFGKVSGAQIPIRSTAEATGDHLIVVGFNELVGKLIGTGSKISEPAPGDESFVYHNAGPALLIYGGKQRGTMYGVMSFLERELGCRWYTPRVSIAPSRQSYAFTSLHHREAPGVRVRNDFYFEAFDPTWAAHNRMNGTMGHQEQPGGVEAYWGVHTFYQFVPPTEFFQNHPEYFSLIDGKRTWDRAQLCLTNPEVLAIVTDRLRLAMRQHPEYLIYCVSQNDWLNPCQCDKCQAIAKREGSEAGPIIWFVNQVAAAVEKEFPRKYVGTLAYQYTRQPPLTARPRANVVVRLCSIEACFAHDFLSCPRNASFVRDLQGWAQVSPQLYIWDYVVNFNHYIMPFPNFRVLQPNIQTLRSNKAIGIMEQAAYQSRGGEFAELRAYVLARLLWNPDGEVEEFINDFIFGYYGRSGQYIRRYFDLLHGRIGAESHIHLGLRPDDSIFSDQFVREADRFFDEAEAVADNEEIRVRVEMARLPLLYLKCQRSPLVSRYDGTYERFRSIVAREGITHYAESGPGHREAFNQKIESAK